MDWFELTDLSQLQSVTLVDYAFNRVHTVVFESDRMDGLMIQICLNYNPSSLIDVLLKVMVEMTKRQ